jgi:hypothetical protein
MDTPEEFLDVVRKAYPKAERIYLSGFRWGNPSEYHPTAGKDIITKSTLMDLDGNIKKFTWLNTCFTWFPDAKGAEKCLQEMFGEDMAISLPLLSYLYKHGVSRIRILVEGDGQELASQSNYGLSEFGFHYDGITPKERNGII